MLPELAVLNEMDERTYQALPTNLSGITGAELDWRPHPEANDVRWITGHLIGFEEWASDAVAGSGRYLTDTWPTARS